MDTEYDWEKGTSVINEKKNILSSNPKMLQSAWLWVNWTKKYLDLNPLHPNTSMHILHTVLHTFPEVLTRRIYLKIKSFFSWWSFSLFSWPQCVIQGWYCKENLDVSHSWGFNKVGSFIPVKGSDHNFWYVVLFKIFWFENKIWEMWASVSQIFIS